MSVLRHLPQRDTDFVEKYTEWWYELGGWCSDAEASALITLANRACQIERLRGRAHPPILEIGAWEGKSTCLLGWVAQRYGVEVITIDPLDHNAEHPQRLRDHLAFAELARDVTIWQMTSEQAHKQFATMARMLYIDGLHETPHPQNDNGWWTPHVLCDGMIAFHDYCDRWPDVQATVDRLRQHDDYCWLGTAGTIAMLQKVKA